MSLPLKTGADVNGQKITSLGDPTANTDAANKQYVDNRVDGLSYKDEVKAATTGNGTLATAYAAGQSLDGYTLVLGDRILLKDQTTQSENGIRVVTAGTPTRATDADATSELNNATVYVTNGTVNGGREYTQTTKNPVVNTDPLVFVQKSTGTSYTADNQGITLSSTQFSLVLDGNSLSKSASGLRLGTSAGGAGLTVNASTGVIDIGQGTGILVAADSIAIDPSVVIRKFAANCAATTNPQTFNHALNNADAMIQIVEVSTKRVVYADVTLTDANNVQVDFGGAPSAGQYRCIVQA